MSFFSAFDNTRQGRNQAKLANARARYKHMANVAKYNNNKAAFKANENARVLGESRARGDAYRKLIIGAAEKHRKGSEQAYKAYAKARRVNEGGRSSKRAFSDMEMLLQKQAALENSVALAGGEQMQQQMLAVSRKGATHFAKNLQKLGVPAQNPMMQPYEKENKFMSAMNFVNWGVKTGANIASSVDQFAGAGRGLGLWG